MTLAVTAHLLHYFSADRSLVVPKLFFIHTWVVSYVVIICHGFFFYRCLGKSMFHDCGTSYVSAHTIKSVSSKHLWKS